MASIETGDRTQPTSETQMRWSSKLTRYASSTGSVAVKNHGKVDVALRLLLFSSCFTAVIVMVTSKQTADIRVSADMTIKVDTKFTHLASFTYFVTAFSVIGLYSIISGYLSYSSLKKSEPSSINDQLFLVLLDSLMLSIATSATGAAGGVAYEALKGNPHVHWMKICHIFDIFCDHVAAAGFVALVASLTLLMLVWVSVCAIVKNFGR